MSAYMTQVRQEKSVLGLHFFKYLCMDIQFHKTVGAESAGRQEVMKYRSLVSVLE